MDLSNWLPSQPSSQQTQHSNALEGRVVRLEVHAERQEDTNAATTDRMKWLERGMQALAVILLVMMSKQAPSSAAGLAELLFAIIRR